MRVDHLVAHGFSERTIANWKRQYTDTLLPLQARAVADTGLLRGENLIVFAPTSSGKTFVAEMAAMRQVERGRKAVFLVPTKALAEEAYARLHAVYSPLGLRVVGATRERTSDDARIAAGRFDLAVMVYEKFKAFLVVAPELPALLGAVVVDELQILGDRERGAVADLLLTKLARLPHPVQLVCLSAVLGENARLGGWLACDYLAWRERPVELREGVWNAADGRFAYREANTARDGNERLASALPGCGHGVEEDAFRAPAETGDHLLPATGDVVRELVERGEQVLVFVPTRHMSRAWAYRFASQLNLDAAADALDRLGSHEESHSRELLGQCLERSAAFHNADLPHDLRALVEEQFNAGNLRVLVATSTLAQGVNLACRNVISVPVMLSGGELTGRPVFVPLSRQRFRNQGGRAGRFGRGEAFGRSILVAHDAAAAERLARHYLDGEPEPLEAPVRQHDLAGLMLDLVHTGTPGAPGHAGGGCDTGCIREFLLSTWSGATSWAARPEAFGGMVDRAIGDLEEAQLVVRRGEGILPTGTGQVAATFGIAVPTARHFIRYLRARQGCPREFEFLALCAFSPDGVAFPLAATHGQLDARKYPRMLDARADLAPAAMAEPLRGMLAPGGGFSDADQSALKKAFLAEAWLSPASTGEIERDYRAFAGTIANLAAHFGWLMQALAAFAGALGIDPEVRRFLAETAARLPEGVAAEGVPLIQLGVRGMTRGYVAALVREGYDGAQALAGADRAALERVIPAPLVEQARAAAHASLARKAAEKETAMDWFGPPATLSGVKEPGPAYEARDAGDVDLELDPASPGRVHFRANAFFLSGLPFGLLLHLARNPRRVVPYRELDEVLWPDAKVEQQQILAHKSAIVRRFGVVCGAKEAGTLLRTVSGQGLFLDLPPERIRVGARVD